MVQITLYTSFIYHKLCILYSTYIVSVCKNHVSFLHETLFIGRYQIKCEPSEIYFMAAMLWTIRAKRLILKTYKGLNTKIN